jgi:predicted Mrr-cat superfamily restriction endonuclease
MTNIWCIRADFGTYAPHFLKGGYAGIGFVHKSSLANVSSREQLYPIYREESPQDKSEYVIGQQVGQIARFLLEMKAGDFVITPDANTELLHYGQLEPDPSYYYAPSEDGCPFNHRRHVKWHPNPLKRSSSSVPFQNTIRSSLTVFLISQRNEFLTVIGRSDLIEDIVHPTYDPYAAVIEQVLQLDAKEFEILVGHLLTALGFEGSQVTGRSGDGGVDAIGELNAFNLAKVKVYVQAKRYAPGTKIAANIVKQLRQSIPVHGQGAFITTTDFQSSAHDVAVESGFPRIGLVNGRQLVDLLIEHWDDIPAEFQNRLGLKPGLVRG